MEAVFSVSDSIKVSFMLPRFNRLSVGSYGGLVMPVINFHTEEKLEAFSWQSNRILHFLESNTEKCLAGTCRFKVRVRLDRNSKFLHKHEITCCHDPDNHNLNL